MGCGRAVDGCHEMKMLVEHMLRCPVTYPGCVRKMFTRSYKLRTLKLLICGEADSPKEDIPDL